ncbi:MAG: hypothetical protein KIT17_12535 [Rubrivivax sp.]|nr:hypothetical protein [Rubrivivax sp.]
MIRDASSAPATALPRRRHWALAALLGAFALAAVMVGAWLVIAPRPAATGAAPADLAGVLDRRLQRGHDATPGIALRDLVVEGAAGGGASSAGAGGIAPGALAESLCDALGSRLARAGNVRVVPCAATRAAVAAALDDAGLARLLGARYVLAGSLRATQGDLVHLRLELRDAASPAARRGSQAPAPTTQAAPAPPAAWVLDEELRAAQVQALPGRVAQAVGRLLGTGEAAPEETAIPEQAYLDFLRAAQLARRPTVADKREAYRLNEQVLAAAPDYEPALYMRLGLTSVLSASATGPANQGSREEVEASHRRLNEQIRALGQRLVARDPASWRGRILLLNDAFAHARWAEALEHAGALTSRHTARHPGVLRIAARLHLSAGYLRQAKALALDAARLNALDAEAYEVLALAHAALGEADDFAETLALARQMGHRRIELAEALLALRRGDAAGFEAAAGAFAGSTAKPGSWATPWVRGVLDPAARPAAVSALLAMDDNERAMRAELLLEWALLGETGRAAASLRAISARPIARWVEDLWWPELAGVRRHAGFADAAERSGLAALWATRGAPDLCERQAGGAWACR